MKLLFAYFDFTNMKGDSSSYRSLGECKLNFSITHDYDVARKEKSESANHYFRYTLVRKDKSKMDLLPKDFWGDRIYNITAMVGKNGAGKSSLLHSLIKAVVQGMAPGAPFLLVLQKTTNLQESTSSEEIIIYCGGGIVKDKSLHIQADCFAATPKVFMQYPACLKKVKIMLLDNTLSASSIELDESYSKTIPTKMEHWNRNIMPNPINEWQKQLYNKSLYSSIRYSTEKSLAEQPIHATSVIAELPIHFRYETYQETRFLFNAQQQAMLDTLAKLGHRVPRPRYVYVKALNVSELHTVTSKRYAVMDRKSSPFPPVCESLASRGFWGKLISNALYVLYNAAYETLYSSSAHLCFSEGDLLAKYHNGPDASQLFTHAEAIATDVKAQMEEAVRLLSSGSPKYPGAKNTAEDGTRETSTINKVINLASKCQDFIQFVSDKQSLLDSVFLHMNTHNVDDAFSGKEQYERKIDLVIANQDAKIHGCMIEFLERYQAISGGVYFMLFSSGLSSGEKNLLRMLTQFRHVLADDFLDDKGKKAQTGLVNCFAGNKTGKKVDRVCDTLLLFLDEADLTYHPEWQRQFISLLTAALPQMFPRFYKGSRTAGCKDIQVIIATHSPLLLSDIPVQNCVFLRKENAPSDLGVDEDGEHCLVVADNQTVIRQTFAANLHDLLNNAFFLNRTIGEFARLKIIKISDDLRDLAKDPQNSEIREKCRPYIQIIESIGDTIIRNKLHSMYDDCFPPKNDIATALNGISTLADYKDKLSATEREQILHKLEQAASVLRIEPKGEAL